jgi:L-asparagine transporter-like permease
VEIYLLENSIPIPYFYSDNKTVLYRFNRKLVLNKKVYDIFNYGSLIVVFVLLILMLTDAVPRETFIYIASFAIVLLIIRIFLRIKISIQNKKSIKE